MKYLHRLLTVASATFFIVGSALAQTSGTVTNHAFALGKGPGVTGYTSLLCGSAQLAVGQTAADPICRTITGDVTLSAAGALTIGANKVTNAMFATMAANTTKCNATAGAAVPTDCDASTMRTNIGTVIGTNVQAFDSDLSALAANAGTGLWSVTGAGTGSVRTITGPAAGITVTNGGGVAGNPTLALANDLSALEGLASTGIARRTGTDAWSVGTAVSNAELATAADGTIKSNISGGVAVPSDNTITSVFDKLGSTQGSVLYRNASAWVPLTPGTAGQLLSTGGPAANPSWITASGSGTVTSVTIAAGLGISVTGTCTITTTGTCTVTQRAPTRQVFTTGTAATYTTPANVTGINVKMCGAGGGGAGSGTAGTAGSGGAGGNSTFSGATLTASGGGGGINNAGGGTGGTGTNGDANLNGQAGFGVLSLVAGQFGSGPNGGITALFGSGTNSGAGGVGGTQNGAGATGPSGGGGGCVLKYIASPAATYTYTIGTGGTAGTTGTGGGGPGVAGFDGRLIVEEF